MGREAKVKKLRHCEKCKVKHEMTAAELKAHSG